MRLSLATYGAQGQPGKHVTLSEKQRRERKKMKKPQVSAKPNKLPFFPRRLPSPWHSSAACAIM